MRKLPLYIASCLMALATAAAAADAKPADSLFVIVYAQGPAWQEGVPMEKQGAMGAHYQYMKKLFDAGTVLDAGPTSDRPGGVVILKAADLDSARAILAADPSITQQMFVGEVRSWAPNDSLMSNTPLPHLAVKGGWTRGVKDGTVSSSADPAAQITLPSSTIFIGQDNWVLTEYLDNILQYAFVDADAASTVQHLYWVQFEEYLPGRPELHHTYESTRHVSIGGMDFLVDTWVKASGGRDAPDSDDAHLHALLTKRGYALPANAMSVRFVHLMDEDRKELMLIYSEQLPQGLTVADLKQGGKAYPQWPDIEKSLIERAQASFQIH